MKKPKSESLIQALDMTYEGTYPIPTEGPDFGTKDLAEGGQALSLHPGGQSMYFGCHSPMMYARVSTPSAESPSRLLEECQYVPEEPGGGSHLGGTLTYGEKIITSKYVFYDGSGLALTSHQFDDGLGFSPLLRVGDLNPGFYGGYMGLVPPDYVDKLGPAFTGQGILSIIGRTSSGPAAFGFNPADLGVKNPVPAIPWLYYTVENPLHDPNVQNELFTRADRLAGAFFVPGTSTFLFVGHHGMGVPCYGMGTSEQPPPPSYCYNPMDGAQGEHAYPYRGQVWAYDVNDFLAVIAGEILPWEVRPYAVWALPGVSQTEYRVRRGGCAFDPVTGRVFVAKDFGTHPELDVFKIPMNKPPDPPDPEPEPPLTGEVVAIRRLPGGKLSITIVISHSK